MGTGISITVSALDRRRLDALVRDRNAAQKHAWRAETDFAQRRRDRHERDHAANRQVQDLRLALAGAVHGGGFRRPSSATERGPPRIEPLGADVVERIVALTLQEPPGEATHWTGAMMAKAAGVSVSSVQRIWCAHGLQPHRVRQFKLSNDPKFVESCATSSGSISIRRRTRSSCRSMRRARSRRWTAPSPACL